MGTAEPERDNHRAAIAANELATGVLLVDLVRDNHRAAIAANELATGVLLANRMHPRRERRTRPRRTRPRR